MNHNIPCHSCGKGALPDDEFCRGCGAPLRPAVKKTGLGFLKQVPPVRKAIGIGSAAAILTFLILILIFNFKLFLRLMAIGGTVLFVLSILIMLLTFRKAKKISPVSLVISMLVSVISLGIYSLFIPVHLAAAVKVWALASGILIGTGWALSTPLNLKDGLIKREGNVWYLAVWGLIFVVNQLTIAVTGRPPQIAMALLLSGTGIVLGNSASFIAMFYRLKSQSAGAAKF
jgi:hypothetical protein